MMSDPYQPEVRCLDAGPAEIDADLVAVPICEDDESTAVAEFDAATGGELQRARSSGEFRGKPYEVWFGPIVQNGWRARRLAAIGAGPRAQQSAERGRLVAAAAGLAAHQHKVERLAFNVRAGQTGAHTVQAIVEGLILGAFEDRRYRSADRPAELPRVFSIAAAGNQSDLQSAAERGRILALACNQARELANEPANVLTPRALADRASGMAAPAGLAVEVLDEQAIARLNMGLLVGVAKGSNEPPRLIVLRHEPPGAPTTPVLGLVGKGITFDSGGISIKPAEGMDRMKDDMSGGAAVICAMQAVGRLKPPIRVIGVVPATENMPSGSAMRPGDILTSASGKTVEVLNTDAEGRLILGDALWYARHLGATHLVDIATLTGACVVALGKVASALFGTPDRWVDIVRRAADRAGDRVWPMPLFDEYAEQLRSEMADLVNTGGRPAGVCTAAMFLKEFTGGLPWAHLDIAGTAWADEARPYQFKGATGVGVRTLAELALTYETW